MNITEITNAIVASYESRRPLMIWGAPGLGKSMGAAEAARILQELLYPPKEVKRLKLPASEAKFGFIDLRLPLLEPIDLRGLPNISKDGRTTWSLPDFLPTKGKGLLFLDEIVQAPASMQAAASQLVLDRRIGEYVLPEGWHVIAAGNRASDRASANAMPTHIANRFVHLYAEANLESWVLWALAHDIDVRVIAFLKWRSGLLHQFDPQARSVAFPSPRSWAFVSDLVKTVTDQKLLLEMVKGSVGDGAVGEFIGFLRVFDKMPSIEQILLNPKTAPIPSDPATRYAVTTELGRRASVDNINKIAQYFTRITEEANAPDYSIAAMKEITMRDAEREDGKKIGNTRSFIEWASKHNHVMV